MTKDQIIAKFINAKVTGENFVNKDLDNYIYASLSSPPIKIIDKCGSDDELDYIVECPVCGSHVKYGTSIFMLSGYLYCDNNNCRNNLINSNTHLKNIYGDISKESD